MRHVNLYIATAEVNDIVVHLNDYTVHELANTGDGDAGNAGPGNIIYSTASLMYPSVYKSSSFINCTYHKSVFAQTQTHHDRHRRDHRHRSNRDNANTTTAVLCNLLNLNRANININDNGGDNDNDNDNDNDENSDIGLLGYEVNAVGKIPLTKHASALKQGALKQGTLKQSNAINLGRTNLGRTKSSGYGVTQPIMKLGVAPSQASKLHKKSIVAKKKAIQQMLQTRESAVYNTSCRDITKHMLANDYVISSISSNDVNTNTPISYVRYNNVATHMAVVKTDYNVEIKTLPVANNTKRPPITISSYVNTQCMTNKQPNVPVWGNNHLLSYGNCVYDVSKSKESTSSSLQPVIKLDDCVTNLSFFFDNRFLVGVDNKSAVHLYSYHPSSPLVTSIKTTSNIINITSSNTSQSSLLFMTSLDKTLKVIDLTTGDDVWNIHNCGGRRTPNSLTLPNVHSNSRLPDETYNLVAVSSVDNGGLINLYDVRSASPAAMFTGHANRTNVCNTSFSPCMRYISCGSEDPSGAATYDLRMGGGKEPMFRQRDGRSVKDGAVVDVQYNPVFSQCATATLGGVVKFYEEAI
jgi:hypothetical protein